jgi:hypothetical protein
MNTVYRASGEAHHRTVAGLGRQVDVDAAADGTVVLQFAGQARSRILTD